VVAINSPKYNLLRLRRNTGPSWETARCNIKALFTVRRVFGRTDKGRRF
jgi:hypothetical protein